MALLLLLPLWMLSLVVVVALCRAGHLEDVARGFVEPSAPVDSVRSPSQAASALG